MRITDWLYVNAIDLEGEWTLGVHHDKQRVLWVNMDEFIEGNYKEEDFTDMHRLRIGFLLFSITLLYE